MASSATLQYDFLAPPRIVFGWGRRAEVGPLARSLGNRAFLVSGSRTLDRSGETDRIADLLLRSEIETIRLETITREPEVGDVDRCVGSLLSHGVAAGDFVLAIGGGSAIDLGKAVAAMATNRHGSSVAEFLEGVGKGLTIERPPLPVLAMPTTAGTGSEATKNAVISSSSPPFKKSLRSDMMLPRIVLVDPELTVGLPPRVTAYTGMDAITQLIESYVSRRARPIPDALCLQGVALAVPAVVEAFEHGSNRVARTSMAHAALLSGLALANSGLGLAHGVAAALGVHNNVPHGLACALMLPAAMKANRDVAMPRLANLGRAMNDRHDLSDADAADLAIETVEGICDRLGIPRRLSELGVVADQLPRLAAASHGNSLSGNPRELTDDELVQLLEGMM